MTAMYLQDGSGRSGPHDAQELRAAYVRGEWRADTLSWCDGERRWIRLGRRWGEPGGSRRAAASGFLVALAGLAALALLPPILMRSYALSPAVHVVAVGAGLLVTGALLALYASRARRDGGTATPRAWLGAVALVAVAAGTAALHVMWRQEQAFRSADPDATMQLSADGRVLRIEGAIAASFVDDFDAALAETTTLERIDITSDGGLIDDALAVAGRIEARRLRVRALDRCASACVLLWAASPARELDAGARIGLHQAWVDDAIPAMWSEAALEELEPRMRALLEGAGFSAALLALRDETPPGRMAWIDASRLLDEGVAMTVVDADGAALDAEGVREAQRRRRYLKSH